MNSTSATRLVDDAVQRARAMAVRMSADTPAVDVASWQKSDLAAAREASELARYNSHEVSDKARRNVARYVVPNYNSNDERRLTIGTYQVQESVLNSRTGARDLATYDFEAAITRIRPGAAGTLSLFDEHYTGRGEVIGRLSFDDLLEMGDETVANRMLASLAARVPTPEVDPRETRRLATFVDLAMNRKSIRGGIDVHAGHGLLVLKRYDSLPQELRAGKPLADDVVRQLRRKLTHHETGSTTVERLTRANPVLANVFDRYGRSINLYGASSVVLDTRAATRSLGRTAAN